MIATDRNIVNHKKSITTQSYDWHANKLPLPPPPPVPGLLTPVHPLCRGYWLIRNFFRQFSIYLYVKALKYHPHGSVLFITFSLEEGLLLANPLSQVIVKSCLATAQTRYPLTICHLIVQASHIHLIAVVRNPADVPAFIRYFKTESAHMINGVLGRDKRTVWCEGYDSPIVLTPLRALLAITYIYSNPAKDNLEESIDLFPGFSSWKMFTTGKFKERWKRFRRPAFRKLTTHSLQSYTKEAARLVSETVKTEVFAIEPNAWLEAFQIKDPEEQERWNSSIFSHIKQLELRAKKRRTLEGKNVFGRRRIISQPMDLLYRPTRHGKRTCCLTEDRTLRISFINSLKTLYAKAKEVALRWKLGDFSLPFPLGLYPPSMPKLAEPIGALW